MRKNVVKIAGTALQDIENVHDYIAYELLEPITADKYIRGIYDAIKHLSLYGASVAVSERDFLLSQYGSTVRNINYKKMAIIYIVENNEIKVDFKKSQLRKRKPFTIWKRMSATVLFTLIII